MTAISMQRFLGVAPKLSGELLPDSAAQVATNVKLYSGDLLPYNDSSVLESLSKTGTLKTLFALRDPSDNVTPVFLSFTSVVDFVTITDSNDDEQRFYYTGDGVPKVSTYKLATNDGGTKPYPVSNGFYELGLPLPAIKLTTDITGFTSATSSAFERDSGNTAIITTAAAHGFRAGQVVTVRDFSTSPSDELNVTNTRITVISTTKFEYFNAGPVVSETANTEAHIDLAGGTVTRDYVYTWYTPWDEESIAAAPSDTLFMKEGQQVTLLSIPSAPPSGDFNITAMRVYRTLSSISGTDFFQLSTLYFPRTTTFVSRASNVSTVSLDKEHSLIVGDRFKLSSCSDATFDIIDGIVTVIDDADTFSYAQTASNVTLKAETAGQFYHDSSEIPDDDPPMYWGDVIGTSLRERTSNVSTMTTAVDHDLLTNQFVAIAGMTDSSFNETSVKITVTGDTTFTYANTGSNAGSASDTGGTVTNDSFLDNFDFLNLTSLLLSDDFDQPDPTMQGIVLVQNNIVAGFFGNQLAFAEPSKPHAWPLTLRRTLEHDIVALASANGVLLVLTKEFAYRVSGADPATVSIARIEEPWPCLTKRSVVNMGYGVLFATHGGIALWSSTTGMTLATRLLYDWDIWDVDFDPETIIATYYNDKYFAAHSGGAFVFERDEKVGGFFVNISDTYTAAWLDSVDDSFYYIRDTTGDVYKWDDSTQPLLDMEWKSKVIVTKDFINLGAARVIADFTTPSSEVLAVINFNASVGTFNTAVWIVSAQLGTMNGPTDYVDTVDINNDGSINSGDFLIPGTGTINGDKLTKNLRVVSTSGSIVFKLYRDKTLVHTSTVISTLPFRLPSGYKSDTFEFSVAGGARVRAIHVGETVYGLRMVPQQPGKSTGA